jgi:hypothetical protein
MLAELLTAMCEEVCDGRGLSFLGTSKNIPPDGVYYVLAGDGLTTQKIKLPNDMLSILRKMEKWVHDGKGECPAEAWFASRSAKEAPIELPRAASRGVKH